MRPVTDEMLQNTDPADWLMWRRTLDSWSFSPLDKTHRDNVHQLRLVWTRTLGPGVQEGTPLVHDGVMYFPNPSDFIQAFDAASGDLLWEYRRALPDDRAEYFPVSSINRNLAIHGNSLIDTSADDYLFALDTQSGHLQRETRILDYRRGAQQTSGPIIANGKVVSGRGCEPEGGPEACVIAAHDGRTGEELWRRRLIAATGEPDGESWGDNGRFRAVDQNTGDLLWEVSLGAPVSGYTINLAVDGRQYVAVSTSSSLAGQGALAQTPESLPGTDLNDQQRNAGRTSSSLSSASRSGSGPAGAAPLGPPWRRPPMTMPGEPNQQLGL